MVITDLCAQYNFNQNHFEQFVINRGFRRTVEYGKKALYDADVPAIVSAYQQELLRFQNAQNIPQPQQPMPEIYTTTTNGFDGYKISSYGGYISGEECELIPNTDFWSDNRITTNMTAHLVNAKQKALMKLKEAAYNLGCNAVVGISFDYINMQSKRTDGLRGQMIMVGPSELLVVANGTAVYIIPEY